MKIFLNTLKFVLLPLLIILAAFLLYLSIGFGKMSFKDNFPETADYGMYFPSDYADARIIFADIVHSLQPLYENLEHKRVIVPSSFDDDLMAGMVYLPSLGEKDNLLIISSGVHGTEGYVGHAVQYLFAVKYLTPELLQQTGVVFLHAVNPYGFKHNRRVTESNVDLNRNCSSSHYLYQTVNEGYTQVYDLINPKGPVRVGSLENRFFFLKAINEIRKASMPVLRQAVLQGQYSYPEGLYFGGNGPEFQITEMGNWLTEIMEPYSRIKIIDLHTGYGERGRLHFFPNPMEGEQRERMEALYDGYSIDWGDTDDFYTVTGNFTGYIESLHPEKDYYPMLFEYGTMNSHTTMGSLKSIHVMILENQGHQHGFVTEKDSLKVKNNLMEMYNPSSSAWRNYIMAQTQEVFEVVLPRFTSP